MQEIWKEIPFHETYEISSYGRVKNSNGRFLKLMGNTDKNPYFTVELDGKKVLIHRVMLMAFSGMPHKGEQACHKNDVKTDNWLDNLYWGTPKDNKRDAIKNGKLRCPQGENHHKARLNDELISIIKKEYSGKRGEQTAIGKKYGISQQHISSIVNGKLWKHVNGAVN